MLSRERVTVTIRHGKPDRLPIYGWVRANLSNEIAAAFGSVDAFEDRYEFDLAHLFGGPGPFPGDALRQLSEQCGGTIDPKAALDLPMSDPNQTEAYQSIVDQIAHFKTQRGRFVYVQTPGTFECLNGVFGIENHLCYLLEYPEELRVIYRRLADWATQFAFNCIDLGVDMIHVSDDWGAQNGLLFSPKTWWKMIFPHHKIVCDAVKQRGMFVSLHSDGNVSSVIDGIIQLGYDVVHPWQESAGMSLELFRQKYKDSFTVMGGLDVQSTLGFGRLDELKAEIERLVSMFSDGGLLFCTTHFVQNHCSVEELKFAFDTVYALARESRAEC